MIIESIPFYNIIVGILLLVIGFVIHWITQLIAVINWDWAVKLGTAEKDSLPEYKAYELGIAKADVLIGWIYGIIGIGLLLNIPWAFQLAVIPGVIFIYHGLSFWFWIGNQNKIGKPTTPNTTRIVWTLLNLVSGFLAVMIAF